MLAGKRKIPMLRNGFIKRATNWTSHFVREITPAKPMAEQMAIINEALVIDLSNCWKAVSGSSEAMAIIKPAAINTIRVS